MLTTLFSGLLVGCGSTSVQPSSTATTDPSKPAAWFCEMGEDQENWDCVQDESLARNPKPTRIPEPIQRPTATALEQTFESQATAQAPSEIETAPAVEAQPTAPKPTPPSSMPNSDPDVPKHIALSFRPDRPMAILDLPEEYYVVQLVSLSNRETLENYAKEHQLRGMSAARIWSQDQFFYVLILGIYDSYDKAVQASTDL